MTELNAYELRLERAFARYVENLPVDVDAMVLTEEIAAVHERRRIEVPRIRPRAPSMTPGARRAAWVLVLVGLLALMAIGLLQVGTELHREALPPQRGLVPTDVEVMQPDGWAYGLATVDGSGMVWAAGAGHVLRLDPATGAIRTWTVHDDALFASAQIGSPARDGGIWVTNERTARRLDGDGIVEIVTAPFDIGGLAEAPDGTLWATGAAAARGIYRWDGAAWTGIDGWPAGVEPGAIAADGHGGVWVAGVDPGGTPAGLWYFDGTAWTTWAPGEVLAEPGVIPPLAGAILAISPAADGSTWFITDRQTSSAAYASLLRFDGSTWTQFGSQEIGFDTLSLAVAPDGMIWVAGERRSASDGVRVARFDRGAWRSWGPADGLPGFRWTGDPATVAPVRGAVYLGTDSGLYRLDGDSWERAWPVAQEGPVQASAMVAVSAEEAWVGDLSGSGVWHYAQGRWANTPSGLPADAIVFDLASGPDGRLWAATEKGVAVHDAGRWTLVDDRWSRGLAFAADGTVWVGGDGAEGGIRTIRSTADGWAVASVTAAGLLRGLVSELAIGPDGTVWAVDVDYSSQGLARFDGTAWTAVDPVAGGSGFGIDQLLVVARDGSIWALLGTDRPTVARFDGSTWAAYGAANGLPGDPSWLEIGPDGEPWVSGANGLARFDGVRWVTLPEGPALPWPERFAVAPDGTIWVTGPSMVGRITTTSP